LLRSKASGGTQENLNLSIIKAIQVPLPDAQQQRQIVMSLDALNAQLNQVKIELTSKLELLNQLKASILDSAFKGEL
jgi:type I restriction enzyme S subunit